jgi:hypothetical protein
MLDLIETLVGRRPAVTNSRIVQVDEWRPDTAQVARKGDWVPSLYGAVGRKP